MSLVEVNILGFVTLLHLDEYIFDWVFEAVPWKVIYRRKNISSQSLGKMMK